MKKLLTFFLLFTAFAFTAHAQNLTQAEKLYNDGDFATALPQYLEIIKTATGDDLLQAQLRAAACQYSQGEYLTAVKTLFGYTLPENPVWKARFLLYRIQMESQVANRYNRILQEREIENNDDMEQWTKAQWHSQMQKDYETLWTLRESLINAPIANEKLILNLKDADFRRIPTLFDFATQQWTHFLGGTEQTLPAGEARTYLDGTATPFAPHKNRADKLAYALETAASLTGTGRQNARVFWQTDLIVLPLERPDFFEIKDKEKATQKAVAQLQNIYAPAQKTSWWQKLKNRVSPAAPSGNTDYGKSYAAYKAAQLFFAIDQREQALQVCQNASKNLSSSYYTRQCEELQKQITEKELSFNTVPDALHPQKPVLSVTARNVPTVYARVYPVTQQELLAATKERSYYRDDGVSYLRELSDEKIKQLLSRNNYQTAQTAVSYPKAYFENKAELTLPALTKGFYAVLISYDDSFNPKAAPVEGVLINITDLALFATALIQGNPQDYAQVFSTTPRPLHPNVFHFYAVNLKTGAAEPRTELTVKEPWNDNPPTRLQTDKDGAAQLAKDISLSRSSNHSQLNAVAQKDGHTAILSGLYFNWSAPEPVKLFAQTDRAIYRPGQKVQISVQGFEKTSTGWQVLPGKTAKIIVRGANGKQIFQGNVTLSDFGTAQIDFTLPDKDLLLGNFPVDVSARVQNETYHAYHSFKVEEYKRPEYEISLDALTTALSYGQKGTIKGKTVYYGGTPLQGATVKYTVTRRNYVPPFYWWCRIDLGKSEQVAQGETTTDKKGEFTLSFTPEKKRINETAAQYTVKAEVYDETGRAIDTSRTYRVSRYPHLFKVDFTQGFYDAHTAAALADITLTNADGTPVSGKVSLQVTRVKDAPEANEKDLQRAYQNAPDEKTVFTDTLSFKTPGAQTLRLPAVEEGVYRLTLQEEEAEKQSMVFVVARQNSALHLPAVTLPQHTSYYPGETARILIGAGNLSGSKRVQVVQQGDFLRTSSLQPGGVSIYAIPVLKTDRGGLAVAWFGASDYTFYKDSGSFTVPFDNQELSVTLKTPEVAKSGQPVTATITAKNAQQKPVTGQASLTVYDKSLDYYAAKTNPFTLTSLFRQDTSLPQLVASQQHVYSNTIFDGRDYSRWQEPPTLPSLNLVMGRSFYGAQALGGDMMMLDSVAAPRMAMAKSASFSATRGAVANSAAENMLKSADLGGVEEEYSRDAEAAEEDSQTDTADVRTDFAETAYFNSQVPLNNGTARVRFTLPQSMTTWNLLGFVLTKNAQFGAFNATMFARKDFMVRVHLPRFYREQDKGILQASVVNNTTRKITVPVTISVKQDAKNRNAAFGLTNLTQTVTVAPQATAFVSWPVTVPAAPGLYQVTAVGRTATDSDGEQRQLPVFPSRERLLAAAHVALQNGNNTLTITELNGVTDAQPELAVLTVHPTLALTVLNKLPGLLTYPYNDLISSLNRYAPLAIVNQFYNTYPQLKEAVQKLPHRDGITAPWNETDPLRLTVLEHTPWLNLAQSNTPNYGTVTSLLDSALVAKTLAKERERILKFQNKNGSFSWFAGGPADDYLTLRALEIFAQAVQFGADVPKAEVQKAMAYIVPKIDKALKEDKTGSVYNVSFALYAAYTLSAFPADWPQTGSAKPFIKKWMEYAETQAKFMTPLGQIYAAAVFHRLGDDTKANAYLDKVLARMKYNKLTGAYFAPEAQSWVWYQDTLTTQTATLKTLLEIRPNSDKIDPMVQWLLFNKQVSDWKNPSAAAKAVFVLLDVMKTKGALSAQSTYRINWAGTQSTRTFEPFDWTTDLRWTKQGKQITPAAYTATVNKQSKMVDFASLNVIYTSAQAQASPKGVLNISRAYFVRVTEDGAQKLRPITEGTEVRAGDEVEVQLTLTADSAFEYVLVTDPKPAGFESADRTSGWTWNPVSMYREVRDADTNYFVQRLPAGTVRMSYVLRPTVPGQFHAKPAQVQSMYAPEYGAHTSATQLQVEK